jgi:hypothetical protein
MHAHYVYKTVRAGQSFRAKVTDRGRAVSGLRMTLTPGVGGMPSPDERPIIHARTDSSGYATFTDVAPGWYFLAPDHDGDMPDGTNVEVTTDDVVGVTIPIVWPAISPLRVQSASGALRLADFYPKQIQPELSLSLLDGMSGTEIATARTDSQGQFAFDNPPGAGIYFI